MPSSVDSVITASFHFAPCARSRQPSQTIATPHMIHADRENVTSTPTPHTSTNSQRKRAGTLSMPHSITSASA